MALQFVVSSRSPIATSSATRSVIISAATKMSSSIANRSLSSNKIVPSSTSRSVLTTNSALSAAATPGNHNPVVPVAATLPSNRSVSSLLSTGSSSLMSGHTPNDDSSNCSSVLTTTTPASTTTTTGRRNLSTTGSMVLRQLQNALEEYRLREYQREVPSRFKKDIVRAAVASNAKTATVPANCIHVATNPPKSKSSPSPPPLSQSQFQPYVVLDGLYHVLMNIGAEHKISKMELQTLFDDIGITMQSSSSSSSSSTSHKMIPAHEMIQLL